MSAVVDDNGVRTFDLRTHIRDPKTGKIVNSQPYKMMVSREHGTLFERGGVRYYPNGDRVDGKAENAKPAPKPMTVNQDDDAVPPPAAQRRTSVKTGVQAPATDAMGAETKAEK
jgi:hypothetical protein